MIIIDIIVGVFVGALVGLGVGGGGLLVIYLTLFKDVEQLISQSVNLMFFIITGIVSLFFHLRKHKVNVKAVVVVSLFGCAGAVIGSIVTNFVKPDIIRNIFGGLLILSGIIEFCRRK